MQIIITLPSPYRFVTNIEILTEFDFSMNYYNKISFLFNGQEYIFKIINGKNENIYLQDQDKLFVLVENNKLLYHEDFDFIIYDDPNIVIKNYNKLYLENSGTKLTINNLFKTYKLGILSMEHNT